MMRMPARLLASILLTLGAGSPAWSVPMESTSGTCGSEVVQSLGSSLGKMARVIASVPAYSWYHGCGPTAAASVLGYWDLAGYSGLFSASGDAVYLTANVQDQISSPAHNAKYDATPDVFGPAPAFTSLADWFRTSVDPLGYGWSFLSNAVDAFVGYAQYRGYVFEASTRWFGAFTWNDLVVEIDAKRPLMFLVDTNGDGGTDHFVPVIGYDDRGLDGLFYGFYTTWSEAETVEWARYQGMGNPWGIGYATFVAPPAIVPEPASWLLILTSLLVLWRTGRRKLR